MNTIPRTLALLKPADLFPAWKWIDVMEECGETLLIVPLRQFCARYGRPTTF